MDTSNWFVGEEFTNEGRETLKALCLRHSHKQNYRVSYGELMKSMRIPKGDLNKGLRLLVKEGFLQNSGSKYDQSYYLAKEVRPKKP